MLLRIMKASDVNKIREIHEKHYKGSFPFPDFLRNYYRLWVVEDTDGSIITAGGLRPMPEAVLITDKSKTILVRRRALEEVLSASVQVCSEHDMHEITAFIQDPMNHKSWINILRKYGFQPINGNGMVLNF